MKHFLQWISLLKITLYSSHSIFDELTLKKKTIARFVGSNNDATLLPLLVNGAVIVEKVSKAVAKVMHHKFYLYT